MDFSRKRALRGGIIHAFHSKNAKIHGLLHEIVLPDQKKTRVLAGGKAQSAPFCLLSAMCCRAEGLSQDGNRVDAAHRCALDRAEKLWHHKVRTAANRGTPMPRCVGGCYREGFGHFDKIKG